MRSDCVGGQLYKQATLLLKTKRGHCARPCGCYDRRRRTAAATAAAGAGGSFGRSIGRSGRLRAADYDKKLNH